MPLCRSFLFMIIIVALFLNNSFAQTIGNYQTAVATSYEDGTTPNTPGSYQWQEISNLTQGVQVSVVPAERSEISIQQTNSYINFNSFDWGIMTYLAVQYDGGSWITKFNTTNIETGWISNPFSTLGTHTITVHWKDISGHSYYRDYNVYVVKNYGKFYIDNYGNTLTCWLGNGNKNSILISEGFDAYNKSYAAYLRFKGNQLFEPLQQGGYNIYILNYRFNSQDLRNSAAIYSSAINYISNLTNHTQMIAAGVSMGGVIARYSLTKAENDGSPLPVKTFVSIDSPQQGAIFSTPLQNYINDPDTSPYQEHGIDNTAAKQLLTYNTYGSLYTTFYNELNSFNNDIGYPTLTDNIGVSFSNGSANQGTGTWVSISYETIYFFTVGDSFDLTQDEKVAGSYLPRSLVASNPAPLNLYFFVAGMASIDRTVGINPTFIPYNSALDIVNGNSKFDITFQANSNYYHDQFPGEVVTELLNYFLPLTATISGPSYLSSGQSGTWTVTASGGTPPYSYSWSYYVYCDILSEMSTEEIGEIVPNAAPCGYWFSLGSTTNTASRTSDGRDFQVKCVVTDANNSTYTVTKTVGGSSSAAMMKQNATDSSDVALLEKENYAESLDNYPNPFNPTTKISFSIPNSSHVSLKIYDILGREVAVLADKLFSAGRYEFEFDASNLPSGTYIYNLTTENKTITKKMLLIK